MVHLSLILLNKTSLFFDLWHKGFMYTLLNSFQINFQEKFFNGNGVWLINLYLRQNVKVGQVQNKFKGIKNIKYVIPVRNDKIYFEYWLLKLWNITFYLFLSLEI